MFKLKDSVRLNLLKMKWDFVDTEYKGIKYLSIGDIDTVLINKETKLITNIGIPMGMYEAIIGLFSSLGMIEDV